MAQAQTIDTRLESLLMRRPVILQMLRFAAIGAINTAIDFIILNFVTKSLGVNVGLELGGLNVIGVTVAIIQGYVWNRAWAFNTQTGSVTQNLSRVLLLGGFGTLFFIATFFGAALGAAPIFYLVLLVGFVMIELAFWVMFGLSLRAEQGVSTGRQFLVFVIVSIIGAVINSVILTVFSGILTAHLTVANPELIKNIAKFIAICFSLIWNFIGYKLIVFKK